MSTSHSPAAREPKRQRGRLRVAAIMEAGVEVFTERGFDAATMTEIAARSETAIASLYRFFPSKETLADALLLQYAQYVLEGLTKLRERAAVMTLAGIAHALVEFRLELQSQRRLAIGLAEAHGASDDKRKRFHQAMLDGIASILRELIPGLKRYYHCNRSSYLFGRRRLRRRLRQLGQLGQNHLSAKFSL
jgi:AcrR family transcriptional regulator